MKEINENKRQNFRERHSKCSTWMSLHMVFKCYDLMMLSSFHPHLIKETVLAALLSIIFFISWVLPWTWTDMVDDILKVQSLPSFKICSRLLRIHLHLLFYGHYFPGQFCWKSGCFGWSCIWSAERWINHMPPQHLSSSFQCVSSVFVEESYTCI